MNFIKRNIPYFIIFYLLGLMLSIWACVETLKSVQRNHPKRTLYERQRLETYKRPKIKPKALSEDGLKFESEHYLLTFSEDIKKVPKFGSTQERISRGLGDLIFMEGQYEFVKKIFGFEAKDKIKIIVHRTLRGNSRDAYTSMSRGMKVVDNQFQAAYNIEVHFGIDAFKKRSVQAHELTHAFTQVYALPAWLSEGIAVLVESEYAGGALWAKAKRNLEPIGLDENGVNIIQNWRGHGSTLPDKSIETYAYSYSIVSELRRRYGDDFFKKFFALLDKDGIHYKAGVLSSSVIVYYMSQAAGEDLVPFFQQLKFNVRKLKRENILSILAN
ncbi:TPA: hypothetical protein EYP66_10145 [Candidatus Poribacteria bacterium]|nr:hypothetical protein [Candidatus Poribacteria bacterium]